MKVIVQNTAHNSIDSALYSFAEQVPEFMIVFMI